MVRATADWMFVVRWRRTLAAGWGSFAIYTALLTVYLAREGWAMIVIGTLITILNATAAVFITRFRVPDAPPEIERID